MNVLTGIFSFLLLIGIVGGCFYKKRRDRKQEQGRKQRERFMEEEHIAAANASRNGELSCIVPVILAPFS